MARQWNGSKWISRKERLAIYLRDGMACVYCGSTVEDGVTLSLDHVHPHSHGGNDRPSNLVTACRKCNSSRGNRSVEEFASAVAAYLDHGMTAEMIVAFVEETRRRRMVTFRKQADKVMARRLKFPATVALATKMM